MNNTPSDLLDVLTLQQVLATIPSGLFLVDLEQRIVYWNQEAERITGYRAEEALGRHCSFLEGIECGEECGLYDASTPKPIIGATCRIRTKSGKTVYLSKNVDSLVHEGRVVGGIESFVDLSKQRKLEERLRRHADELEETVRQRTAELEQERRRLRGLLDAMDDLAYIATADYRIAFANRAITDIFGPVTGRICYETLYESDQICPSCPMAQALAGETVREERFNPITQRTYDILHTHVRTDQGGAHKLSVCRDITERKQSEEALRAANQELDSFVHTVSHDLRTPLTPIIGFAEFLLDQYGDKLEPQVCDILKDIETQGQRMLHLIEDLLELARVGTLPAPAEPVELRQVARIVSEEFREEREKLAAQIAIGELPQVRIPATLLHQLLANLVSNALHYGTCAGGRIEIGGERKGHLLRLFVRDFGPGIAPEERERIFELFYRGKTVRRNLGTGVGLATVRKIARLYQGRAWVEETPGGGCTFQVELREPNGDGLP
jgi:PAS domain S-box-containing protein